MKIQNRSSVINYDVSQDQKNAGLQETKKQSSQVVNQPALTETERKQRVGEFKAQEQLVRTNLSQQVQETFPEWDKQSIGKIDQNKDGRTEGPRQQLASWRRIRREVLQNGVSRYGRFNRKDLPVIERRIRELLLLIRQRDYNRALRDLQNAPDHDVLQKGGSEGPESDFSSDPMNPRGSGSQKNVISTPGNQQGGPMLGPQPGQGGTLTGQQTSHQNPLTPGRSNSHNNGKQGHETGGSNDNHGVRGGHERSSNNEAATTVAHQNAGPVNVAAYHSESTPSYKLYGSEKKTSESQTNGGGKKEPPKKDPIEQQSDQYSTGLPVDPENHGKGGNDLGANIEKYKVKGITQQVKDLVGPAFGKTTGADDKERPNTGNVQGTVWNPTEGRDLGDDLRNDSNGGGSIDIEAGKVLLEQLRPIDPGGPDPTKTK